MNDQATRYYEFGPFRLSLTDRLLMREDRVVSLTPKVVDTLILLVENHGHVVNKNTLMETLWPDSFVEESSLTQNVSLYGKPWLKTARANNSSRRFPNVAIDS